MIVRGDRLTDATRRDVLRRFPYRMTTESIASNPTATATMRRGGYRMPIISDVEWLATKAFHIKSDGTLDNRHSYCEPAFMAGD